MDSTESSVGGPTACEVVRPIRNDDMEAGDYYIVQSDSWHGRADPWHGSSHLARRPAECALAFNFGDRLASMTVDEWWCHLRDVHDPFLAIYNNCAGQRDKQKLLVSQLLLAAHCILRYTEDTRPRNWHHKSTLFSGACFWYVCHMYIYIPDSGAD